MNHFNISTNIDRPQHEINTRLKNYFDEHAPRGEMRFTLRAPAKLPVLRVGLTLERDVIGSIEQFGGEHPAYRLSWRPTEDGPFPIFTGAIFVGKDEDRPERSVMTLDGHYEPPFEVAGWAFDAAIGTKIAHASATDLLARLSASVRDAMPAVLAG